jgi:hypothetical protein
VKRQKHGQVKMVLNTQQTMDSKINSKPKRAMTGTRRRVRGKKTTQKQTFTKRIIEIIGKTQIINTSMGIQNSRSMSIIGINLKVVLRYLWLRFSLDPLLFYLLCQLLLANHLKIIQVVLVLSKRIFTIINNLLESKSTFLRLLRLA